MERKVREMVLIAMSWCILGIGYGQAKLCGIDFLLESQLNPHKDFYSFFETLEKNIDAEPGSGFKNSNRRRLVIPLVFHIVKHERDRFISDEQIWDQIERLNSDFAAKQLDLTAIPPTFRPHIGTASISFCLASKTLDGKKWNPIIRKTTSVDFIGLKEDLYKESTGGSDSWGSDYYLNVWIADTGPNVAGFGTFPGLVEDYRQGIVIHPDVFGTSSHSRYNLGRVLTHETGHYLGLLHPWGHANNGCLFDDQVDDTPWQSMPYFGCPASPQYSCGSEDMFMTFMDYVDDGCMHFFTKGQIIRMEATLSNLRPLLGESTAFCSTCPEDKPIVQKLYPNPGEGRVSIVFNSSDFSPYFGVVNVYSTDGMLLQSGSRLLFNGMVVDIEGYKPGVYFIGMQNNYLKYVKM
jgi:hypothetical protein